MSNILIIKHGSLGDLIQANGAIKDIKELTSMSMESTTKRSKSCRSQQLPPRPLGPAQSII